MSKTVARESGTEFDKLLSACCLRASFTGVRMDMSIGSGLLEGCEVEGLEERSSQSFGSRYEGVGGNSDESDTDTCMSVEW